MSKRYTKAELLQVIRDVLCGGLEHLEAVKTELRKYGVIDEHTCDPTILSRVKVLSLTLVCINDILHPAHRLCYSLFPNNSEYFDVLVRNHKIAFKKKMLPPCYCEVCSALLAEEKNGKKEQATSCAATDKSAHGTDRSKPESTESARNN